jgi:hypothetical protein
VDHIDIEAIFGLKPASEASDNLVSQISLITGRSFSTVHKSVDLYGTVHYEFDRSATSFTFEELYSQCKHSGIVIHTHPSIACTPPCAVHQPTDHNMRDWELAMGENMALYRICPEHDIPHPDPDQFAHWTRTGEMHLKEHDCCGCCHKRAVIFADTNIEGQEFRHRIGLPRARIYTHAESIRGLAARSIIPRVAFPYPLTPMSTPTNLSGLLEMWAYVRMMTP